MTPTPNYCPAETLDEAIERRRDWTPATEDNGACIVALALTATRRTIVNAALLSLVRDELGMGWFDSTLTNNPAHEIEAA